jgi:hypothetical protein
VWRVGSEIRAPATLVDATFCAIADAGSIPAVSTFEKYSNRPPHQRGAILLEPAGGADWGQEPDDSNSESLLQRRSILCAGHNHGRTAPALRTS